MITARETGECPLEILRSSIAGRYFRPLRGLGIFVVYNLGLTPQAICLRPRSRAQDFLISIPENQFVLVNP